MPIKALVTSGSYYEEQKYLNFSWHVVCIQMGCDYEYFLLECVYFC